MGTPPFFIYYVYRNKIFLLYIKMPVKKLNFSIAPLNDNPAQATAGGSITNGFSHKNGFPTIKFTIPAQDVLLDTQSLYLSGQMIVRNPDDSLTSIRINDRGVARTQFNTQNETATSSNVNMNTSNWNGVSSVIDKVVIQSKKTQTELSSVINYSLHDALKMGLSNNEDDYKQSPLVRNLACGSRHGDVCRHLVNMPNVADIHTNAISEKWFGQFFSFKIDVALLRAQALHLGNDFVGGLIITLHLASDASVFHTRHRQNDPVQVSSQISGSSYVLKGLKLEGKYMIPTPADLKAYNPNVVLNSRVNLMNDVVSSNNSNVYTPQLSSVKSVVNVFLDDDQSNNYNQNTNNFRNPLGLVGYLQAKNNIRFPYDFQTKAMPNPESGTENLITGQQPIASNTLVSRAHGIGDSEVRRQFLKSVMGAIPNHNSATFNLTATALANDWEGDNVAGAGGVGAGRGVGLIVSPDLMGVGADYTNGIGQTQNYVNQDYELKLDSSINTGTTLQPNNRSSKIVIQETFVRNFSQMNLQTLQKQQ